MSIHLRKDTGKWIVVFKDENGKRREKCFGTGEDGHQEAIKFDAMINTPKTGSVESGDGGLCGSGSGSTSSSQCCSFGGTACPPGTGVVKALAPNGQNLKGTGPGEVIGHRDGVQARGGRSGAKFSSGTGTGDVSACYPRIGTGTGDEANAHALTGIGGVGLLANGDTCMNDTTGTGDETESSFGTAIGVAQNVLALTGTGDEDDAVEKNEDGLQAKTVPTNPELGIELMDGPKPEQVQHRKSYAGADPKVIKYLNLWDMYKRNPDPKAPITMGELIGEYVRHVWVRGCSTEYVKSLSTVCKNIILPFFGDTSDITSIDYAFHIVPFFEMIRLNPSRLGKMRSNRTINGYGRYLKAIFNYAVNSNYILKSPMRLWKELKEVKINRELTYEDGFKIMKYCLPHVRWALELICVTGMRPGRCELFSLQWKDVDFENNKIRIYSTKTNTVRYISFKEDFKEKLLKHKSEAKTDYVVEYNGKQIRTIKRNFSVACQLAKINYHVRPYDYRHVFATTLLNKGADLAAVSKLMGHSRITTTVTSYYETRSTELQRAIDLIPDIPND